MANPRTGSPTRDVAVYIDYENLYVSLKSTTKLEPDFDIIMEKSREFGRVTVARAYADWSEFGRVVTSQMFASGLEPIYVPTRKFYDAKTRSEARKNSVDIHITIDIIKSLFLHENVDVFMIVSGDRDYVPLINQIRQAGKEVYALGVAGCTSSELSVAADEMFFYHQLLESTDEKELPTDVYTELVRAVHTARRRGYGTTLGILKPIMRELVEGFNERNYKNARGLPFQKFKDLVLEGERRRLVRLITSGSAVEVYLWGEEPPAATEQPSPNVAADQRARERGRERERERDRRSRSRFGGEERPAGAGGPSAVGAGAAGAGAAGAGAAGAGAAGAGAAGAGAAGAAPGELRQQVPTIGSERAEDVAFDPDEVPVAASPRRELSAPVVEDQAQTVPAPVSARPAAPVAGDTLDDSEDDADDDDDEARQEDDDEQPVTTSLLTEESWSAVRRGLLSFGERPPSPRKLMNQLKKMRETGELKPPSLSDDDLQSLVQCCVLQGRIEKVSRGFTTILRLKD